MFFGLMLFTILLYIRPVDFVPFLGPLHLTRTVAILTFLALVFNKKGSQVKLFKDCMQTKWMTTFFIVIFLSICTSVWRGNTIDAASSFLRVYIGYLLIINVVDSVKRFSIMTGVMVTCGLILALMAVQGYNAGTVRIVDGRMFASFSSLVGDPNDFAQVLLMLIPFSFVRLLCKNGFFKKVFALIAITVFLYAIILTGSRGGLLGLVAISLFSFLKAKRKFGIALLIVCAGLIFWNVAPENYKERIYSIRTAAEDDPNSIGRLDAWKAGFNMMTHRVFGVGAGNFGEGFYQYRSADAIDPLGARKAPHNMYIQAGGEMGFVGFFVFLALLSSSFKALNNVRKVVMKGDSENTQNKEIRFFADATFVSLAGFCVTGLFLSQTYSWFLYYLIGFSVALERIVIQKPQGTSAPRQESGG